MKIKFWDTFSILLRIEHLDKDTIFENFDEKSALRWKLISVKTFITMMKIDKP